MTLQDLELLKENILSEQAMSRERKKVRITVGMGTCGIKAGAQDVLKALKMHFEDSRGVIVSYTGCLGMCSREPVMQVAAPGRPAVTYFNITPDKARRVAGQIS
ncbi:(2Fe-2S) ferredoxin domain-containing protein [Phosphitispora fastidiosa]|uniref:(2Fe-2S) ferredoxin domain-containing protein n=1 Tax=Phosphitispora fastidiosa TaxID=2837202 RepID=UPI001E392DE0|nr:(2Fe-2S) ferredoxin domain-containing protein [Phosphitispora fastidiosa]MBU7008736.1 (2Fe-2S) ferredoxin [Phosphitispora fastidiosa]